MGDINSYNDYYPFGQQMPGRNLCGSADGRYKFTSKELDPETSLYYFVARYYAKHPLDDSWSGTWLSVDPLANKYPGWSPYNYVRDNPIGFVDPNGAQVKPKELIKKDEASMVPIMQPNLELSKIALSLNNQRGSNPASISSYGFAEQSGWETGSMGKLERLATLGATLDYAGDGSLLASKVIPSNEIAKSLQSFSSSVEKFGYVTTALDISITAFNPNLSVGMKWLEGANEFNGAFGLQGFVISSMNSVLIAHDVAAYQYDRSHITIGSDATSASVPIPQ